MAILHRRGVGLRVMNHETGIQKNTFLIRIIGIIRAYVRALRGYNKDRTNIKRLPSIKSIPLDKNVMKDRFVRGQIVGAPVWGSWGVNLSSAEYERGTEIAIGAI